MPNYVQSASVKPRVVDLYWAAGFLEGDGYFTQNGKSTTTGVIQKQREPLERLLALFGGSIRPMRQYFDWRTSGARSRGIMMTVYLLLSPERQARIRQILEVCCA